MKIQLKDLDRTLFGTKIYNTEKSEKGLLLYTWTNAYADCEVPFATCVDENGKRYNIAMDRIVPIEGWVIVYDIIQKIIKTKIEPIKII